MGNSTSRVVGGCFVPSGNTKDGVNLEFLEPLDEGLGHSFCYIRPVMADSPALTPSNSERYTLDSSTLDSETYSGSFRQDIVVEDSSGPQRPIKSLPETTFKAISGASVSANVSTIRTGSINVLITSEAQEPAASFESTASFAAIPLQPVPRGSGPLNGFMSGPLERGFMSGPLERGFMSGPIDKGMYMSGPIEGTDRSNFSAPLAYGRKTTNLGRLMRSVSRPVRSALSRTFTKRLHGSGWMHRFLLHPMTKLVWHAKEEAKLRREGSRNFGEFGPWETEYSRIRNLQWAHGKAGEDRVHVVLSEEQGWLFVGIYDGFSGPDAPDFLMSNLYKAIDKELEGLLWDYDDEAGKSAPIYGHLESNPMDSIQYEKGECVGSQLRDDDFEKQCGNLGSQSVCFKGQCEGEVLPVRSNEDESGGRPITAIRLGGETLETGGIIVEKGGLNGIDHLHVANEISKDQGLFTGVENAETTVNTDAPESESFHITAKKYRKSKRLYELLQMERVEDFDMKSSQVASASNENSWHLKPNSAEELYTRETLPTAGLVLCSRSIGGGSSASMEEASSLRESEGVLEESSRNASVASVSPSGQKHMMKRSLFASKMRKMYRKQKSLRKKLFPWSYDWHRDKTHVNEGTLNPSVIRKCKSGPVDHDAVMKAMSRALEITEEAYMEMVEKALDKNPELALMGSCVLVMLMKDQDVYVMNLGDSRAILAQDRLNDRHSNPDLAKDDARHRNRSSELMVRVELDRISEESPIHNQKGQVRITNKNREISLCRLKKRALQLSTDHSTDIEEEVIRIKAEHADDAQSIMNGRVKGQLKVSRAFGAGFLKKADFNEALLEMFRIDYIGSSPYISCIPWVLHHRLCSSDRFLVLSSDGLYQYFSNEEVVSHVAWFMENVPEGDPAQYLIAELLFRAAKKNGMDFHDLLDIPQGDRRKYHDDVSVMVISLEGRIWRSSG